MTKCATLIESVPCDTVFARTVWREDSKAEDRVLDSGMETAHSC